MVPRRSAAYHLDGTMLRRLRIENLVLIHEAELAFAPGLNAITGETGAGKTILAQAIGLLLGAKGDAAYIGPDGAEAYVEAELVSPQARPDQRRGFRTSGLSDGRVRAEAPPRAGPRRANGIQSWSRTRRRATNPGSGRRAKAADPGLPGARSAPGTGR